MKKSEKFALGLALIFLVLGSLLCISTVHAVGKLWDRANILISGQDYQRKEYSLPAEQLQSLLVDADSYGHDIRISGTDAQELKISYVESKKESYEIDLNEKGELRISCGKKRSWFYFSLNLGQRESTELRIFLPKELAGDISLQSGSGDVNLSGLNIGGSLSAASSSGNLLLQDCRVQQKTELSSSSGEIDLHGLDTRGKLEARSSSGDICLENSKISGPLLLESSSGEQQVENLQIEGMLQMETTSGELELDTLQIKGDMQLKTTSGDVELEEVSAQNMDFHSTSGDISGTLLGDPADYNFNSRSTSGSIRLPAGNGSLYTVRVKTTSGDVHLQMQGW
ncbi:MAG: DUF4097 family beta strand repeat-containing protein [Bacillota bacterium]|nr:DUF4097 family beta strand repeat-containing protein [Bacillota bacterium]